MGDASAGAGAWREGCGPASTRPHLRAPKPGAPWGQTPPPRPAPRPRNPPPPLRQPPPPRRRQRPHAKPLRSFRADSAEPRLPQAAARTTCSFPGRSAAATGDGLLAPPRAAEKAGDPSSQRSEGTWGGSRTGGSTPVGVEQSSDPGERSKLQRELAAPREVGEGWQDGTGLETEGRRGRGRQVPELSLRVLPECTLPSSPVPLPLRPCWLTLLDPHPEVAPGPSEHEGAPG